MPATRNDIREVHAGSLPVLEDLLWEWVTLQERTARLWGWKDPLWWCSERASLGGFAGAVWRVGGIVLEEYPTDKLSRIHAGRQRTNPIGRGDMDFTLEGVDYVIEAKQCWPGLSRPSFPYIQSCLAEAEKDVRRAIAPTRCRRLAVVFAAPSSIRADSIDERILDWLEAARDIKRCAFACVFPSRTRALVWRQDSRIYPGAAIFLKAVRSRDR
jgi:hypothetical protein